MEIQMTEIYEFYIILKIISCEILFLRNDKKVLGSGVLN